MNSTSPTDASQSHAPAANPVSLGQPDLPPPTEGGLTVKASELATGSEAQEVLQTSLLQPETPFPTRPPMPELSLTGYLIQLLVVAILTLGMGYIALKFTKNKLSPITKGKGIKILERLPIDPKRALMVVGVGERRWLVGMGESEFSTLAELKPEDFPAGESGGDFGKLVQDSEPHVPPRFNLNRLFRQIGLGLAIAVFTALLAAPMAYAQTAMPANPLMNWDLRAPLDTPGLATPVMLIFMLSGLSILPFLVIMTTSFMRTIIVLGFLRQALGTQSIPPNPVLLGIALFLTMFTMAPVWETIDKTALQPYMNKQINQQVMFERAQVPLREFMLRQVNPNELGFFVKLSRTPAPQTPNDVPLHVIIPAFMVSELGTAFKIGFIIYVPFLVIDLVVANTLMALGMSMLPPQMISTAFKILIFSLANGWHLILQAIVQSFK
ncbi:Flagellar biosynthetic protein FliP precursor [compost metagenome]